MEEEGDWVMARKTAEKDWWTPSLMVEDELRPLKITFSGPAKHWTDAIPIGNGRLGAMVWGGVATETIQLNEDTLWLGQPGDYTNPNAPEALSVVRKLVDDGHYAEATEEALKLSDDSPAAYQLVGEIKLDFGDSHLKYDEKTYHRELDLDTATAKVKYSVGDVEYTREHFASNPNQVIAVKITGSKPGSVSFTASLDSKMNHHSYGKGGNQIVMEGSCTSRRVLSPKILNEGDYPKGIQFSAILKLQISSGKGQIHLMDDSKVKVKDSDWAVLLLVCSSSFEGPFAKPMDSKKNPTSECLSALMSMQKFSYSHLYAQHLDDYKNLFHRVSLQLSKSSKSSVGNESQETTVHSASIVDTFSSAGLVKSFQTDEDPSMVELLFQFGRYLLISCSRPGTQVANLQGIWNKDIQPPWDGAQHLNINLQMNYWPALPCNLHECQEPLFDYTSSLSINGSKTAKVNYEAKGWVAHQVTDLWAKTSPDRGDAVWALWPMGGAWISTHLWEHYTYTMDKDFLRNKAYPLLEGCTSFLLDWLIDRNGKLETNPSTSPEHRFTAPDGKPASVSYSSTMDMSIVKEVFSIFVSAAEIIGKSEEELVQKVQKTQLRLSPTKISRDGSIMEWAEDFADSEPHHRHVSHLFGLFPGHAITVKKTPDLCKAADYTLNKRGIFPLLFKSICYTMYQGGQQWVRVVNSVESRIMGASP